jgi:two-component system sensor histidine kinase KdpD
MNHTDNQRPDPDELLSSLKMDEERSRKGKLKIFFGMCAGVGKTYNMLKAAQTEKSKGIDIIIGFVETHNRRETAELVEGFEIIPRKKNEYKGTVIEELDLDAIIARKPQIVIVDELAHTNAPGSRHTKRYHNVLEILENGISVYTTLNVQHLESRSDTVAQITGITVRETVPDEIFENADEVELIDLPPEELIERLAEGKVYTPEKSREAIENFFRKGNITALREMALRLVADRVDRQLHEYLQDNRIRGPWKSGLHLLVAIDYNRQSTRLMRWAKTLAYSMGASIQALYVEETRKLKPEEQEQLDKNIRLAKQLGIKVRIITDNDKVKAIVAFANRENATHILVGKPRVRNLQSMFLLGNFVNRLIRYSGNIDVYVLGSDQHAKDHFRHKFAMPAFTSTIRQYFITAMLVALTSVACYLVKDYFGYQVISFVLLFLVAILALFFGKGPILLASSLSALIWDYFFIPPQFTMHIEKAEDMMMLIMFFIIALLNGILTSRVRIQQKKIKIREERTHALYQLARDLSVASGIEEVCKIAWADVRRYFDLECMILLKDEHNHLYLQEGNQHQQLLSDNDYSVADWVFKHTSKAGRHTNTLPSGKLTFYPLAGSSGNMGVIAIELERDFTQGEEQFWDTFLSQISGKFEREFLRNEARKAYIINESEKLYKTLFNSISHELRIPVTTIIGASDALLTGKYSADAQQKLCSEINIASLRLNHLIENLLNMSRLESGRITPRPDWCDVHDLANVVSDALKQELEPFTLNIDIDPSMPLVYIDMGLMEQVLHNLLLNATQYSSPGTPVNLAFSCNQNILTMVVSDRGRGFPDSELSLLFQKFYRGKEATAGGTGLGLSIVKGFVEAHQGSVSAANRADGGAVITITIPVKTSELNQ